MFCGTLFPPHFGNQRSANFAVCSAAPPGDRACADRFLYRVVSSAGAKQSSSRYVAEQIERSHTMTKKDEYLSMMEAHIKKWDAEVDKLRAKGEQMSAEARVKYAEQIKAMRANRDAAYKKLHEMRAANESAWQHMQSGIDTAWDSMKNALDKASSQFKK
jgi:hypothetical protein